MSPVQSRLYIISLAKTSQLNDPAPSDQSNLRSLQGSPNRYLYAKNHRPSEGQVYPANDFFIRPSNGQLYPRTKKRK